MQPSKRLYDALKYQLCAKKGGNLLFETIPLVNLSSNKELLIQMFTDILFQMFPLNIHHETIRKVYRKLRSRSRTADLIFSADADYAKLSQGILPEYLFPVRRISDPIQLMQLGYFPYFACNRLYKVKFRTVLDSFVRGISPAALALLHDENACRFIRKLHKYPIWRRRSLEHYKLRSLKSAYSLPLLLQDPCSVYSASKRPRTDMSMFLSPNYRTYNLQTLPEKSIRVTRYARGNVPRSVLWTLGF